MRMRAMWAALVIAPLAITAAAALFFLPDTVPLHWGPNGLDRCGNKYETLVLGGILSGCNALFCLMAANMEKMMKGGFAHGIDSPSMGRAMLAGVALLFAAAAAFLMLVIAAAA